MKSNPTYKGSFNLEGYTKLIFLHVQTFNGKKWEKLNSEKVALLAYARIQGKAALCAHFENSSLMNEDKRCRPVILYSEGSDNIDQVNNLSWNQLGSYSVVSAYLPFEGSMLYFVTPKLPCSCILIFVGKLSFCI